MAEQAIEDLEELAPAADVRVRHRGADVDVGSPDRSPARAELRKGAIWCRAGAGGPGLEVIHGEATVQVAHGAVVIEADGVEAVMIVVAGRTSVHSAPGPARTVSAGQAVTLTLDGHLGEPVTLAASEIAADRMIVVNLALDSLASQMDDRPRSTAKVDRNGLPVGPPAPSTPAVDGRAEREAPPATPVEERPAPDPVPQPAGRSALEPEGVDRPAVLNRAEDQGSESALEPEHSVEEETAPETGQMIRPVVTLVLVVLLLLAIVAAVIVAGDGEPAATTGRLLSPTVRR